MIQNSQVTPEDKFLFDLQGFLVLREVLSPEECQTFLSVLDGHKSQEYRDEWIERMPASVQANCLRTCERRTSGHVRFNGLLRIDPAFDALIAHPKVMPYLKEFIGMPQLINSWSIEKVKGSDPICWHRGVSPGEYSNRNGIVRSRMLNVIYFLTDNGPEDGCAAAVPASHKNAFDLDWADYENLAMPGSVPVTGKAGDVFLFSEAVLHYGLPKTSEGTRTNLYFNYAAHDFNVMVYDPTNNYHYCLLPDVRERFTVEQQEATLWMEWAHSQVSGY